MYNAETILADRENRSSVIKRAALSSDIVTVKANIPGFDKHLKEGFLLVAYFVNRALEKIRGEVSFYDGPDGFCAIIAAERSRLKEFAVELEQTDPVGRFIDIDVFPKGGERSLSRGYARKCFICDEPAFVCARQGAHSSYELSNVLKSRAREYFSARIYDIVKESLMAELDLEDKFGLVTPSSQGSHKDLDYGLMIRAQNVIIPFIAQAFFTGLDGEKPENLLGALRHAGIEAERAMYEAVGANAYKGFIFVGGILLAAAGSVLSAGAADFNEIFSAVKKICRNITNELNREGDTFGAEAYKKYKITGVRGHAEKGFYAVARAENSIDDDISPKSLKAALCKIVGDIEDTVLLKRSRSFERYICFKNKISSVDTADEEAVRALTRECIENNISIGGSADVLAAAVILKKLSKLFYFKRTSNFADGQYNNSGDKLCAK